jgi:hypothetical protein
MRDRPRMSPVAAHSRDRWLIRVPLFSYALALGDRGMGRANGAGLFGY